MYVSTTSPKSERGLLHKKPRKYRRGQEERKRVRLMVAFLVSQAAGRTSSERDYNTTERIAATASHNTHSNQRFTKLRYASLQLTSSGKQGIVSAYQSLDGEQTDRTHPHVFQSPSKKVSRFGWFGTVVVLLPRLIVVDFTAVDVHSSFPRHPDNHIQKMTSPSSQGSELAAAAAAADNRKKCRCVHARLLLRPAAPLSAPSFDRVLAAINGSNATPTQMAPFASG